MSPARAGEFKSRGKPEDWHPLTRARYEKGRMTQQQLADAAGVNRSTVAKIEGGKEPLVSTALRLAAAVDRRVEDIWGGEG